jgi:hypothetical protein
MNANAYTATVVGSIPAFTDRALLNKNREGKLKKMWCAFYFIPEKYRKAEEEEWKNNIAEKLFQPVKTDMSYNFYLCKLQWFFYFTSDEESNEWQGEKQIFSSLVFLARVPQASDVLAERSVRVKTAMWYNNIGKSARPIMDDFFYFVYLLRTAIDQSTSSGWLNL